MVRHAFPIAICCTMTAVWTSLAIAQAPSEKKSFSAEELAKRNATSVNNLKTLTWALEHYRDARNRFPGSSVPGKGNARLSWRVSALSSLKDNTLFYQFHLDEPWDSEHNLKMIDKMPAIYRNPFDDTPTTSPAYFMLTGKGTLAESLDGIRTNEVTDGRAQTITLVEAKRNIPWTKPEDIEVDFDATKPLPELGLYKQNDSFNAAFADGAVRSISKKLPPDVFRALLTPRGGEKIPLEGLDKLIVRANEDPKVVAAMLQPNLIERLTPPVPEPAPKLIDRSKLSFQDQAAFDRKQSKANLNKIMKGLLGYEDSKRSLPPQAKFDINGKPLLSWRVLILPYMDEFKLYEKFNLDEPWDSPQNIEFSKWMPAVYADPSVKHAPGTTVYQAIVGPGLAFEGTAGVKLSQVRDGAAATLAVVEVDSEHAVPWTKPADWECDLSNPFKGLAEAPPNKTFQVTFCDGRTSAYKHSIDPVAFRAMLTRAGQEKFDEKLRATNHDGN